MRNLYESFTSISDMKEYILNTLNDLSKEDIERIYNIVLKSNISMKVFDDYFEKRGILDAKDHILNIFINNGDLDTFINMMDKPKPTLNDLKIPGNIYNLVSKFGFNKKTLEDLAKLCKSKDKNARGIFEIFILTLFDDINEYNLPNQGHAGDVHMSEQTIEIKGYEGRICTQSTPQVRNVNQYLQSKYKNISILDNYTNLNKTVDVLKNNYKLSIPEITDLIAKAMISQFNPSPDQEKYWVNFVNGLSELWNGDKIVEKVVLRLWGTLDMYAYHNLEGGYKFDYLIAFKKNPITKGDFIIMKGDDLDDLDGLYDNKQLSYTAYPRSSHNSRESVVKIQVK